MKKNYQTVEIELIQINREDIIITSVALSSWNDLAEDGATFGEIFN